MLATDHDFVNKNPEEEVSTQTRYHTRSEHLDTTQLERLKKLVVENEPVSDSSREYLKIFGINGHFQKPLNTPDNVSISYFSECEENPFRLFDTLFQNPFADLPAVNKNKIETPFVDLNSSLMSDGLLIHIRPQQQARQQTLLIHIVHGIHARSGRSYFPRIFLLLDEGATASVIESYRTLEANDSYLCAPVTQASLKKNAQLNHIRIQNDADSGIHIGTTQKILDSHARLHTLSLSGSGKVVRHDLHIKLVEQFAHAEFNGLFLTRQNQAVDHHTVVDHRVPMTTSRQLYHGMVHKHGKGIFNGKILVRPGADGTDARQTNKNLLLSTESEINTKPELQIEADDVKCSHGAAIGQLDANQLLYLRSRGISEDLARKLLIKGFASDVIERFPFEANSLKKALQTHVEGYFS